MSRVKVNQQVVAKTICSASISTASGDAWIAPAVASAEHRALDDITLRKP